MNLMKKVGSRSMTRRWSSENRRSDKASSILTGFLGAGGLRSKFIGPTISLLGEGKGSMSGPGDVWIPLGVKGGWGKSSATVPGPDDPAEGNTAASSDGPFS